MTYPVCIYIKAFTTDLVKNASVLWNMIIVCVESWQASLIIDADMAIAI